tara:strand:+ start:1558 stop:4233 length:2676 start_codon:yes stop_codon:yes gene_type:complete
MRSFIIAFTALLICTQGLAQKTRVYDLKIEGQNNPLGITNSSPNFSWKIASDLNSVMQTHYQIMVSKDNSFRTSELVWDSQKIESDQSQYLKYKGPKLKANQRYFWKVRVWNTKEKKSTTSSLNHWSMGLSPKDWTAKWITQNEADNKSRKSPYFKKDFSTSKNVQSAFLHISAQGMYEAHLNGKKIGDDYLTPGWTAYNDRIQYQTYDVSQYLTEKNALGVVLGSGWHRGYLAWSDNKNTYGDDISFIAQLIITYQDGSQEVIESDRSWNYKHGAIIDSELYDGEFYNALLEYNWCAYGIPLQNTRAAILAENVTQRLVNTHNETIKAQEILDAVDLITTPEGDQVLDFGQNLVGWIEFSNAGQKGDTLRLYHAEILDKNGSFYTENLRDADQLNTYILNDNLEKVYRPHFTFQGFRYVKVEGVTAIDPSKFKAVALYSDMQTTGHFESSNQNINQLQQNILWGQKGNFLDVPTDCPQRDERLGWTGDAQAFYNTASFNMEVKNFFDKWLIDLSLDQREDGSVPWVIPNVLGESSAGSAGWADAATIIPYNHYLAYGDKEQLAVQYESMKNWVEYMYVNSIDGKYTGGFHFGDWLFFKPEYDNDGRAAITNKELIAQCFYAKSTSIMKEISAILGYHDQAKIYESRLEKIKTVFLDEYMTPNGRLVSDTQTAYVLALAFDLIPEGLKANAAKRLADNVKSYDTHLTTGFLGTPYLCHVLTDNGYEDLAISLLLQETYPSWLYPVTMGATTIWERWDGIKPDGSTQTPTMNSYNHYAYGAIGEWMYKELLGIKLNPQHPGFKKFKISPLFDNNFEHIKGHHISPYGKIAVNWESKNEQLHLSVVIPANTRAEIELPENRNWKLKSAKKWQLTTANFELGSGGYELIGDLKP